MVEATTRTHTFYDFFEMVREIDKVLGYDQRSAGKHFFPNSGDFDEWHKLKGYPKTDPDGKGKGSSQIWYKEYQADVRAKQWDETPYMDFWHWQMDHCVNDDFGNDRYSSVDISMDCCDEDTTDWQKEIQQVWHDTFKDIADENGWIEIWVSW